MNNLNEKQQLFCIEYIKDFNATQAAIRAGYSEKTAYSQGQRLLKVVEIQAGVKEAVANTFKSVGIEADRVIDEIAKLAFLDIGQIFDENKKVKPIDQWPEGMTATIAAVEFNPIGELHKVKFWSKEKSLELLCKYLGILVERREVKTDTTIRVTTDADVSETIAWMEDTIRKQETGDTTAIH